LTEVVSFAPPGLEIIYYSDYGCSIESEITNGAQTQVGETSSEVNQSSILSFRLVDSSSAQILVPTSTTETNSNEPAMTSTISSETLT
jgi:hypothetical protein